MEIFPRSSGTFYLETMVPVSLRRSRRIRHGLAAMLLGFALAASGFEARAHAPDEAQPSSSSHAMPGMPAMHDAQHGTAPADRCTDLSLQCATVATPFFDARGVLWLAWAGNGAVSVASSKDGGRHFAVPVVIGQHGARLDAGAESHPQIVVNAHGQVVVAYGVFKDDDWNAQVLIARSPDGTRFTAPQSISRDAASQRFPVIAFDGTNRLFAAWIDKRTAAQARKRGTAQPGAAIAYAWSDDAGATMHGEAIAEDRTCECCRLDLAFDAAHRPVLLFRKIYGENERDHAVLAFDDRGMPGQTHRVALDRWHIDGCPHHGPALAISSDGVWHAAWFTAGEARQGLYYARSSDEGRTFSAPQAVGDTERQAGRPSLLARGASVWLAWKEFDGKRILARVRHSRDGGVTWSADRTIETAQGLADRPLLVADEQHVYLSWLTREHGYRLIELNP
ncbi:sialidase family protein [Trinickia caryophylli]|uniref:BNR repeat-like domain-containing protein n=1 Tax=Trinickia caryophylli TaxID=28094 RepID=A0A1X7GKV1_TRICW|nr:sialidase family protein [Trinickia caryophylli]PMS09157.1 exo-alpha-sialidase [Trinickia caryophylli]WQE14857.1 sialidase family protein [Trinickia caryophylli]GLU35064.1 lipoprotein [Trinickia caryophylli]SMF71333.1 hypothetical protein SAMN06295900_116149 [Trinickia caryophylli]